MNVTISRKTHILTYKNVYNVIFCENTLTFCTGGDEEYYVDFSDSSIDFVLINKSRIGE